MIVDTSGQILYINKAGSDLGGQNTLGKNAFTLLHAESYDICEQALDECITTNKNVIVEKQGRT